MKANEKLLALVNRFPGPTNHAVKDPAENKVVGELVEELLAGGPELVAGLADLIVDPAQGTPEDAKARYLLRVAVNRASADDLRRKPLAAGLAAALSADRTKDATGCLIRELQWIAGAENAPALGKFLTDETLSADAARTLATIGGEPAAKEYRAALAKSEGRIRVMLLQNLGVVRDQASAAALKEAAGDADAQVRMTALWALANLGEPTAAPLAMKAVTAEGADLYERNTHTKSCFLLAERLAAAGKKAEARQLYDHLRASRSDDKDAYIREAAERGLAALNA